jgi:hypothetical protein
MGYEHMQNMYDSLCIKFKAEFSKYENGKVEE